MHADFLSADRGSGFRRYRLTGLRGTEYENLLPWTTRGLAQAGGCLHGSFHLMRRPVRRKQLPVKKTLAICRISL